MRDFPDRAPESRSRATTLDLAVAGAVGYHRICWTWRRALVDPSRPQGHFFVGQGAAVTRLRSRLHTFRAQRLRQPDTAGAAPLERSAAEAGDGVRDERVEVVREAVEGLELRVRGEVRDIRLRVTVRADLVPDLF